MMRALLSHGSQAPWHLGMFASGANIRASLTYRHVKLGKIDQGDQGLSGPDPREQLANAQVAQSTQGSEHREHPDHAKSS
jgi:hypothetical protein